MLRLNHMTAIAALLIASLGFGQGHPLVESFSAIQVDDHIQLDFAIIGGGSCNGVQLLRSSDGVQFFRIDEIQGICGGSEFTEHYTLLDESPLQATTNHYKLVLGFQGESQVIQLNFVPLNAGFNVFPNPVQDWAVLKWDNPTGVQFTVDIYNLSGHQVEHAEGITSSEIFLQLRDFLPGTYIFQLIGEDGRRITGKFIRV